MFEAPYSTRDQICIGWTCGNLTVEGRFRDPLMNALVWAVRCGCGHTFNATSTRLRQQITATRRFNRTGACCPRCQNNQARTLVDEHPSQIRSKHTYKCWQQLRGRVYQARTRRPVIVSPAALLLFDELMFTLPAAWETYIGFLRDVGAAPEEGMTWARKQMFGPFDKRNMCWMTRDEYNSRKPAYPRQRGSSFDKRTGLLRDPELYNSSPKRILIKSQMFVRDEIYGIVPWSWYEPYADSQGITPKFIHKEYDYYDALKYTIDRAVNMLRERGQFT